MHREGGLMQVNRRFLLLFAFGVFGVAIARAQEPVQEAIPNWPAPATWSPHSLSRGVSTMGAITSPLPFIGVTPCRVVDTRNPVGPFGGPAFTSGLTRSFTIPSGPCSGIPIAGAYSLNFTVVTMTGFGFLTAWPTGTAQPLVSTLDYVVAEGALANAAIVPASGIGAISVFVSIGTDVIIDINGYYAPAGVGTANTFLGRNAGNFTRTGDNNTGFRYFALSDNTTGNFNTATGQGALFSNTTGNRNTANGGGTLQNNTMGIDNTATGEAALFSNTTGGFNTATGDGALQGNTTGLSNTANGSFALFSNTTGNSNTAIGANTLQNTTGFSNIGIGQDGGLNLTTGSNNICIGNSGVAGESSRIRIGSTQTATFVAGVNGVTTGGTGTPVLIDANGQLGTVSSSARFKDEIQDMGEATEGLLKLRPVTFRYKAQPEGRTQFGLIAEEVEKVMPELVVCSSSGEVETVLSHEMPAMLLNELQKQQRQIDELQKQQRQIEELKSELSALRAVISQRYASEPSGKGRESSRIRHGSNERRGNPSPSVC